MDEIDGISGNSDRGGLAEVIKLLKTSSFPVICICNDRSSLKIRNLVNYCLDLKVFKPKFDQIKDYLIKICKKENIDFAPIEIGQIVNSSNYDIRLAINLLQMKEPLIASGLSILFLVALEF